MAPAPRQIQEADREPRLLPQAPEELTGGRLRRLGEGIGKVVYASENWVIKRERTPFEIVALIVLWRILRRLEGVLPFGIGRRLLEKPSKQIRFLRILVQATMLIVPKAIWFQARIRRTWKEYHFRDRRGERLAQEHLTGTLLIPRTVAFPPTRVQTRGWPGWLTVSEATERVEATLHEKLSQLAGAAQFDELEQWLNRFLDLRRSGWSLGLFSVDAHLKNFGVIESRVVLLDSGGLTDRWTEIEDKLSFEEVVTQPHIQLGLGALLASRPDIAGRFNARWKATVNREVLRDLWPRG